jgi:hypothetical protein
MHDRSPGGQAMTDKIALVTTTINVPHVLRLYRKYGPEVQFFVIGDRKTPHAEVDDLCRSLGLATYYSPELQQELDYACSDLIGWNTIQRRNIGFLEALKWGADVIVTVDDDNIPMDRAYLYRFWGLLNKPFSGLSVTRTSNDNWFDVGIYFDPPITHRGFPIDRCYEAVQRIEHVVDVQIGVAAGLWFGSPDIHVVDRISQDPQVHRCSQLLHAGLVVDPRVSTVFNSQNTAFRRELTPAMMMWPGVGRYDDICASLITQRVMRERGLHVHFGQPFVYQQRNAHDWMKDLHDELWGMTYILDLAEYLDGQYLVKDTSVLNQMHNLYTFLPSFVPSIVKECGQAWLEDCEKVMA